MDSRLVALKRFLEELGVSSDISSLDDRKQVQKAVYLGQRAGADLADRFGWYRMGPYSPDLTRDYYDLAEALEFGDEEDSRELRPHVRERLSRILPLLMVPEDVALQQPDWLELVASYDYLHRVSRYDQSRALDELRKSTPLLARYAPQAEQGLKRVGLLA